MWPVLYERTFDYFNHALTKDGDAIGEFLVDK